MPRSGQVFLSRVAQEAFSLPMSTAHLPEIFSVKELSYVSIFRNPPDAIASLMNKLRENGVVSRRDGYSYFDIVAKEAVETYKKFINAVENNLDNVSVIRFEELVNDYQSVIKAISDKFSIVINQGYEANISLDGASPIWSDKYDGHGPREKDGIRLAIEERVFSMPMVCDLTERYQDFLTKV